MKFKVDLSESSTFKGAILFVGGMATILFLIFKDKESASFILGATVTLTGLVGVGISDKPVVEKTDNLLNKEN
jgi:hypothetical protein